MPSGIILLFTSHYFSNGGQFVSCLSNRLSSRDLLCEDPWFKCIGSIVFLTSLSCVSSICSFQTFLGCQRKIGCLQIREGN